MLVVTIIITVLAVVGALIYNRLVWRPRQASGRLGPDGLNTTEISVPILTLASLLLVFVLVQVFSSWSAAGRAETDEATSTLLLFREAQLLANPRLRREVRADLVCYATSIIDQEWPAMADQELSNVPTYWAAQIREAGIRQARAPQFRATGEAFVRRDGDRARARQDRLGEARPSVPIALYLMMLFAVAVALVILGVVTAGGVGRLVHVAVIIATGVAFGGTLLLVRDFDQPYSGLTGRDPDQTVLVRNQMAAEVRGPLPCDARGLPRVPGFRPSAMPLT